MSFKLNSIRTVALGIVLALAGAASAKNYTLLNVSYDPTRELYKDVNKSFISQWEASHPGNKLPFSKATAAAANRRAR